MDKHESTAQGIADRHFDTPTSKANLTGQIYAALREAVGAESAAARGGATDNDARYIPLYGCCGCYEECSWPAEDLHVLPNGDLCCANCHDYHDTVPTWHELPSFVPPALPLPTTSAVETGRLQGHTARVGSYVPYRGDTVREARQAFYEAAIDLIDDPKTHTAEGPPKWNRLRAMRHDIRKAEAEAATEAPSDP